MSCSCREDCSMTSSEWQRKLWCGPVPGNEVKWHCQGPEHHAEPGRSFSSVKAVSPSWL